MFLEIANLVSVGQLTDKNYLFKFYSLSCGVQDLQIEQVIMKGHKIGRLFHLDLEQKSPFCPSVSPSTPISHANDT